MLSAKKYTIAVISSGLLALGIIMMVVIFVDPYFQYHKPNENIDYKLNDQRYQNHGIVKNFEYNSILLGTSMSENFRTSIAEELFGGEWIKVCLSGSNTKERLNMLEVAFRTENQIDTVINSLDTDSKYWLVDPEEILQVGNFEYPTYLYNQNIYDDVNYWFNKNVIFEDVLPKLYNYDGNGSLTSFDEYSRWDERYSYGEDYVKENYIYRTKDKEMTSRQNIYSDDDRSKVLKVLDENFDTIISENLDTEFIFFVPPYSIAQRKLDKYEGYLIQRIEVEKEVIKYLMQYENVKVFSWNLNHTLIEDLALYKDVNHYSGAVSDQLLMCIYDGVGEINSINYEEYCELLSDYYLDYDYDSLLQ